MTADPARPGHGRSPREVAISVAVFAHNEELHIRACLTAVAEGLRGSDARVFVLANGCRDATVAVARRFCSAHPGFEVVEIALGDKANAWNVYVHALAPQAAAHVFVDGDTLPDPRSFAAAARTLDADAYAHGVAGLPVGGRNSKGWRANILRGHGLPGPFYALRGAFVARVRAAGVRLPVGLIGDDVLVPILVRTDLLRHRAPDLARVRPCADATFSYASLSYRRPAHWRLYIRRRVRNSLRHFQNRLLIPRIKAGGLGAIPESIAEIYDAAAVDRLSPRPTPLDFWFDRLALKRIRAGRRAEPRCAGVPADQLEA